MIPEYLDVPIFPLPNVTLFPNAALPLHIFEPRYREMVANALAGDRLIGMALLREGWQEDYFGRPPIYRTFGVGKIVDSETMADGRSNIVLEGVYRARLIEEHAVEPYRAGRVWVMQDEPIDQVRADVSEVQREMFDVSREISSRLPRHAEAIQSAYAAHPHPGVVSDLLASALVPDAYDRQSILESPDPLRRMRLTLVQLRGILHEVGAYAEIEEEVYGED